MKPNWNLLSLTRFILAMCVVLLHLEVCYQGRGLYHRVSFFMERSLGPHAMVMGFFLISGYSIAYSLNSHPDGFFARRFWRIGPSYYFALLATLYMLHAYGQPELGHRVVLGSFLFLEPTLVPAIMAFAPSWSLGCEVWYYVLAPLLRKAPSLLIAVLGLVSIVAMKRFTGHDAWSFNLNFYSFAWVWIAGFLYVRYESSWIAKILFVAGTPLVLAQIGAPVSLVTASAFVLAVSPMVKFGGRWMEYLGDLSYPLYIVHYPIIFLLSSIFHFARIEIFLYVLLGTLAVHHLVEVPIKRWRRQRRASRTPVAVPFDPVFLPEPSLEPEPVLTAADPASGISVL